MRRTTLLYACLLGTTMVLAGCKAHVKEAAPFNDTVEKRAAEAIDQMRAVDIRTGPANVQRSDDIYLGSVGVRLRNGQPLPTAFERQDGFDFFSPREMTLSDVAREITLYTGIPVSGVSSLSEDRGVRPNRPFHANYRGPLSGFLNQVAAYYDLSWEHRDGTIRFYGVETRNFTLMAPPTSMESEATIQTASSAGGGAGADNEANIENTFKTSLSVWERVDEALDGMISDDSASYSLSPETGTITVTARGPVLSRVEDYIRRENQQLSKQVSITVHVLKIDETDSQNNQINIDALLVNAGNTLTGATLGNIFGGFAGAATTAADFAQGTQDGQLQLGTIAQSLNGDGTLKKAGGAAIAAELARVDERISLVDSASVATMNNHLAPLQVGTRQSYVAESKLEPNGDGQSTLELTPGSFTTGFSMSVLPRVLDGGRIALQYGISMSELLSLDTFGNSQSEIQLPQISTRDFMQTVVARSGDTVVVGAFRKEGATESERESGILSFANKSDMTRELIVVLMTPEIQGQPEGLSLVRR
ncbi:hypothetical protein CKO28_02455 [Rhodovibrio sodomensis]|uniref:Type II/III secretion system secretin-like domain-containing protein n=1 Tax=Rhodovibrio sodomensis TaxID=1088 RepID=A0ABS1DBF7_9PROT|nr:hypothetical protein [Rhodovibrio sodomensis]MBK1666903.1 hypothetical protein [Rhodovibrio sodomensis]